MTLHLPNRRSLLRAGGAGMLGLSLPKILRGEERTSAIKSRAKSVIFLFQWGGPSQLDTFDMKPDAPDTVRSPYRPIATSAPGIQICELMPEMSKWMDRVSLIRTMTHKMKNHASAGYYALSGHEPPSDDQRLRDSLDLYPAYGSVVDHLMPNTNGMPTFVAYPHVMRDGSVVPAQHASFLGKQHDPLFFLEDPNARDFALPELSLPQGLSVDRLQRRREMQKLIDQQNRMLEYSNQARGFDQYYQRAISMLTSDNVRKAFDLSAEKESIAGASVGRIGCEVCDRLFFEQHWGTPHR
jgi:hypothetical protein